MMFTGFEKVEEGKIKIVIVQGEFRDLIYI